MPSELEYGKDYEIEDLNTTPSDFIRYLCADDIAALGVVANDFLRLNVSQTHRWIPGTLTTLDIAGVTYIVQVMMRVPNGHRRP